MTPDGPGPDLKFDEDKSTGKITITAMQDMEDKLIIPYATKMKERDDQKLGKTEIVNHTAVMNVPVSASKPENAFFLVSSPDQPHLEASKAFEFNKDCVTPGWIVIQGELGTLRIEGIPMQAVRISIFLRSSIIKFEKPKLNDTRDQRPDKLLVKFDKLVVKNLTSSLSKI